MPVMLVRSRGEDIFIQKGQHMNINPDQIAKHNAIHATHLETDYTHLGSQLERRGINIADITARVAAFKVAVPLWGVGTGGTRFGRFPGVGEPRNIIEKLEDCGVIHQLTRVTAGVSTHFPWDKWHDYSELLEVAQQHGLHFDAVNSNTFQDQVQQTHSYKFGSLSHTQVAVRQQAIDHNLECISIGRKLESKALTVWLADGSNFPGQSSFSAAFGRYLESLKSVVQGLPQNWTMFLEHKCFEPAFYSTVLQDWGSNFIAASQLGEQTKCLVDLGHHAPNTNIEQIVSRLAQFGKLGGFHFNDSKYGDDDLDAGSINPFMLFLVFNQLLEQPANYAYMLDQSHNITDPIESLMQSAGEIVRAYTQALLVDRSTLEAARESNDALLALETLKTAFRTDVSPILASARVQSGGAANPLECYRASGYRAAVAAQRPSDQRLGGGIV
jgi:L-rhamnose isomerase / sugar isomerase